MNPSSPKQGDKKPLTAPKTAANPVSLQKEAPNAADLEAKVGELTDVVQRLQAEFENFQKRVSREKALISEAERMQTLFEFLPFWQSLENAVTHAPKEEKPGAIALESQFAKVMESQGVRPIQCIGKPFDPSQMDALARESRPDKPDGIVLEEIQKGYWFKDRVLRHAKVTINSHEIGQANWEPKEEDHGKPSHSAESDEAVAGI